MEDFDNLRFRGDWHRHNNRRIARKRAAAPTRVHPPDMGWPRFYPLGFGISVPLNSMPRLWLPLVLASSNLAASETDRTNAAAAGVPALRECFYGANSFVKFSSFSARPVTSANPSWSGRISALRAESRRSTCR